MKINIFSYRDAEKKIINDISYRKNWISIRDVGYDHLYHKLDELCENVCIVTFDDVTEFNLTYNLIHQFYQKEFSKREPVLFNSSIAQQIIKFTNQFKNNDTINIHCWAGKSRSQAIGYCLNQYYNLFMDNNEEDFIHNMQNSINNFNGNYDVIKVMNKSLFCI